MALRPDAPLRVLHLTTAGDVIAGAEQLLLSIARTADRSRWSLAFSTLTPRGPLHEQLAEEGWPVHALGLTGAASLPAAVFRLQRLIGAYRPDILHGHLFHASLLAAFARALDPRIVLVQTRHYSDLMVRFHRRRVRLDAWSARRCARVIAVSDASRNQLVDVENVPRSRVTVVDNGVDWERLAALDPAAGRRALAAAGVPSGLTIGTAGRFVAPKGHIHLLRAFAEVAKSAPRAQLVLLGDGPLKSELASSAGALGIAANVHFVGHRADAHLLLSGVDIYVQPSTEEGFGLAVIEAMAMRRPVVVTAVGGMLHTVAPEVTGLRVEPASPAALAQAILRVSADPALAARLGEKASASVRERYSLERMNAAYDDVYRRALEA